MDPFVFTTECENASGNSLVFFREIDLCIDYVHAASSTLIRVYREDHDRRKDGLVLERSARVVVNSGVPQTSGGDPVKNHPAEESIRYIVYKVVCAPRT